MPLSETVNTWFRANARDLPWRRAGFGTWGILVSEFMLQQTPVIRVIPRLKIWLERWPTPAALAAEPSGEAVRAWSSLGYPRRALNLHAAATAIADNHDGVVPEQLEKLLALPGVGEYTARAVAVFAYGHRHPVVDTNVRRVLARAVDGFAEPAAPSTKRDLAAMDAVLPVSDVEARVTNAAIMELGAVICVARTPRCGECPLAAECAWRLAGYPVFTGTRRPIQKKFDGSDRQMRGLILKELRASDAPVQLLELAHLSSDPRFDRALAGLLKDGLAAGTTAQGFELPQ